MLCRTTFEGENEMVKTNVIKKSKSKSSYIDLDKEILLDNNGVRITNEYAERILKENEHLFQGRPSLSAPRVHSPQLKVRVPEKLKAALDLEAKRRGQTPSALIREALESFLAKA